MRCEKHTQLYPANQWEGYPSTSMHRREDNIKTDLKVTGCEYKNSIQLSRDIKFSDWAVWTWQKTFSFIISGQNLDQLSNYQPIKNYFAPYS
jgi:hypothetical protein